MLASKFPTVQVWTGPRKYLTAQTAVRNQTPDLVIVDDGFQHRSLRRDFDLVLLDCTASPEEEMILPLGRFREGFASLQRAHAVILTKVNWASEERLNALRGRIPNGVPVYELEFHSRPSRDIASDSRVLALSGIARPHVFEKSLEVLQAEMGISFKVASHLSYADHFDYQKSDIEKILQKFRDLGVSEILTTEKDFVKLRVYPEIKELLNPLQISTQFRQDPSELYAFLDRSRRH
jgi:tetraacyldisaccharide 4'-kinase